MKRAILLIIVGAALGGGVVWLKFHGGGKTTGDAAAAEPPAEEAHVTHDTNGNVVVNMDDETQGDMGLQVTDPVAAQFSPEVKGYGRVQDPAPLAALAMELAEARAAHAVSSNELARLKTLAAQGNASTRALETADAATQRDQLAVESARQRLLLTWGRTVADQADLPAFVRLLANQEAALVRVDVPAGETLSATPGGARIAALSGNIVEAEFFGMAAAVDPQMQGRGYLFLLKTNSARLLPGEAVNGFIKLPGEPRAGVIVPRSAVVRTDGAGWVYLLNEGGESFTRIKIELDHPVENGWFVSKGVVAADHVVATGAQMLLSEELKATIKAD